MTIQEMAKKEFPIHEEEPFPFKMIDAGKQLAYTIGAKAVLEEIEKALEPEDRGLLYNAIKAKIKELKQ